MNENNKKGRIIKLKRGYNPNSSSVGSQLPWFLAFAAGSGLVSVIIMNILGLYDNHIRNRVDMENDDEESCD